MLGAEFYRAGSGAAAEGVRERHDPSREEQGVEVQIEPTYKGLRVDFRISWGFVQTVTTFHGRIAVLFV
jgi:hypothetical protein